MSSPALTDPNERKYFISPKSVEQLIQEEIAKAAKAGDSAPRDNLPKYSETENPRSPQAQDLTRDEWLSWKRRFSI